MNKKYWRILCTTALVISLAGCSNKEAPKSEVKGETNSTEIAQNVLDKSLDRLQENSSNSSNDESPDYAQEDLPKNQEEQTDLVEEVVPEENEPENTKTVSQEQESSEHSFYGWYISYESAFDKSQFFSVDEACDDVKYNGVVFVDTTSEQQEFIDDNAYEEFKITYESEDTEDTVERVKPISIEVVKTNTSTENGGIITEDPLKGLVADDILEKFRAERPVKTNSIYDEADALGHWVQKTIGKDNFSEEIKEMGLHIGNRYEFYFGTDIANNFDNNFSGIYGAYFTLKDYYTSDGERSKDFYEGLIEENEFIGNGDPQSIRDMYSDLRDFITACNNVIRKMGK